MTLTKYDLVKLIQKQNGYTKQQSIEMVDTVIQQIRSSLENGDDILISGFGKFQVKQKYARRGRNPATGEELTLEPRKVVTFRCSGILKDKLNGKGE